LEGEWLIGEVASPKLKKKGFHPPGYGIYVTNDRIIGVQFKQGFYSSMAHRGLNIDRVRKKAIEAVQPNSLLELETMNKDFEVRKGQVTRIEVKKPGAVFGGGHLSITERGGEKTEVLIVAGGKKEFESITNLMREFLPGAVKVEE
jgi:hypothetical protein